MTFPSGAMSILACRAPLSANRSIPKEIYTTHDVQKYRLDGGRTAPAIRSEELRPIQIMQMRAQRGRASPSNLPMPAIGTIHDQSFVFYFGVSPWLGADCRVYRLDGGRTALCARRQDAVAVSSRLLAGDRGRASLTSLHGTLASAGVWNLRT
ncbi:hypothetical protein FB451DRAFT_1260640 [Mycena latifolia]|nr:hypothetical protein FB451DRAFT_1260640 [Mycena latifolia]